MSFRTTRAVVVLLGLALLAPVPLAHAGAGDLDPTFDGDGKAILAYGGLDYATEVLVQPDGRILVAGFGTPNQTSRSRG
jgi:hypothetical protein